MSATIGIEELHRLKNEFRIYLREANPNWSDSTVSTIASDAFFALNNSVGIDFWASLIDEESILAVREEYSRLLDVRERLRPC